MKNKLFLLVIIPYIVLDLQAEKILFQKEVQIAPRKVVTNEVTEEKKEAEKKKQAEKKLKRQITSSLNAAKEEGKVFTDKNGTFYSNRFTVFTLDTEKSATKQSQIYYSMNHAKENKYTSPFSIHDDGLFRITYFAVDDFGNKENKNEFSVVIDNVPPKLSVLPQNVNLEKNGIIITKPGFKFRVSATDSGSGIKGVYADDGTGFLPVKDEFFELQNTGNLNLKFVAEDNLGNKTKPIYIQVLSDNKKPSLSYEVTKTFEKDGVKVCSPESDLTLIGKDGESGINRILFRKNGKTEWSVYDKPVFFSKLTDVDFEAIAYDDAENISEVIKIQCKLDKEPPETKINILKKGENK